MNRLTISVLLKFFPLLFVVGVLSAQTAAPIPESIIKGFIVDSTSQNELPFANISLLKNSDSSFVTGIAAGNKGEFTLNNIPEGSYYLKISYVGYDTKIIPNLFINNYKKHYDLGSIKLYKSAYELEAAQVTGEKVSEELHLDKKVINVSQNLNYQGGTALDVLQNQPSVQVDPDGTVYLRGSSNFTILVNGKPYPLQGSDALRQIPANSIENIEIITNPSSKYDSEGTAGIININLKTQTDKNLSGILNLNSASGDKYNTDFSGSYNYNGMNITTGLDYRSNIFRMVQQIDRTSFLSDLPSTTSLDANMKNKSQQYSFRGGIDYTINNQNSLGLNFSIGKVEFKRSLTAHSIKQSSINEYMLNKNSTDIPISYFNSSFNYGYKINPDIDDISFELTYNHTKFPNTQLTDEYYTDYTYTELHQLINRSIFFNESVRNEGRSKLNYKHIYSDKTSLETGLQVNYSYRDINIVNRIFNETANDYLLDLSLTNNFNMKNNVYAGFISFNSELFDFNYMIGVRSEYTDRNLKQNTLGEDFTYEKLDFFPSLNISKKIDDHQLQFSYSRRINRPNENLLNPFRFYSDANISLSGNPKLLPEYINSFELNYQKMFGSVYFSAQTYYRNTNNSFAQTYSMDSNGKLNLLFKNYGKIETYGAELSTSFTALDFIKIEPSVNLYQTNISGNVNDQQIEKEKFNFGGRLNTTFNFSPDTRLQISSNYVKFMDAQTESKPFMFLSASLRHEFFDKTMSLTFQARNLFKVNDMKISSSGSNFITNTLIKQESPVFALIFSFNFNNFKRTQKQTDNVDIPSGF